MKNSFFKKLQLIFQKKLLIIVLVVCFLFINGFILIFLYNSSGFTILDESNKTHTIILKEEGFSPQSITIQKGDTVTFKTDRNESFWPASNLHPTHTIYSEFDPKKPVPANETWSFIFDKIGKWTYHDHLFPFYRGEITVVNENKIKKETNKKDISRDPCETLKTESAKAQCQETFFTETLKEKGIEGAFALMDQLFQKETTFASNCHDFAHRLGEETYYLLADNKDLALSTKSSYCGYGFYHGFMEALLFTTGDLKEAQEFCDYAEKSLSEQTSDAGGACYHGIGHGIVEDTPDPKLWGNAQKIIQPGLELCKKVSPNEDKLFRCDTGVFNALEILMTQKRYNLSYSNDDPYAICKQQEERHKKACFTQFVVAVMNATNNDFSKSAKIIDEISDNEYANASIYTLALETGRNKTLSDEENISFCRQLSTRLQLTCIYSIAEGFMKYGPPQKEYIQAIDFCNSSLLTDAERQTCFSRILGILRIWYNPEKAQEICQSINSKYHYNKCQYS